MKLKIGNKVAVLDDVVNGVVTNIDGETIEVLDDTGMYFSYLSSELVKIEAEQFELTKYSDIENKLLIEKLTEKNKPTKNFKKEKNQIVFEVDLHIHQLTNSTKGMDNYDMLNLQLDTAKRKLEYAIQNKLQKVVFIHGVGEGVLKTELQYLFKKYPVKYYDASYQKYGLGATEVYIFQTPN
ncbi:MAG: DNA mismatch repair protein MutS [Flavobacteriaceae bacterium]|nr:DNA mismatch repair protein MutS [Flavobacteriaceae bacterium]